METIIKKKYFRTFANIVVNVHSQIHNTNTKKKAKIFYFHQSVTVTLTVYSIHLSLNCVVVHARNWALYKLTLHFHNFTFFNIVIFTNILAEF